MLIDFSQSQLMALTHIVQVYVEAVVATVEPETVDLLSYLNEVGTNKNRHAWLRSDDYLASADVWTVLDLIALEFSTDPNATQYFDRRLVARAIDLARTRREEPGDYHLTPSQVMALQDILLAYILDPTHTEVFVDVVRNVETTPEDLLRLFTTIGGDDARPTPPDTRS